MIRSPSAASKPRNGSGARACSPTRPPTRGVQDRVDRSRAIGLEGRGQGSRPALVEERRQRLDPFVAEPAVGVDREDTGQVAALVEEIGRLGQLGRDERGDGILARDADARARCRTRVRAIRPARTRAL